MIDYISGFQFNSLLGIFLYWLPMGFCAYGYFMRTYHNFQKDKAKREEPGAYYSPTDKLGTLIGRGLVSIIPVANLCAAVFDVAPEAFARLFIKLEQIFDIPLVPDSDSAKAQRDAGKKRV